MHDPPRPSDFTPIAMPALRHPDCEAYSLSFFDTLNAARKRWHKLNERLNATLRFGDRVGLVDLELNDGLQCDPNKHGHFELHEDADVQPTLDQRARNLSSVGA
jgi:hypothetical protein